MALPASAFESLGARIGFRPRAEAEDWDAYLSEVFAAIGRMPVAEQEALLDGLLALDNHDSEPRDDPSGPAGPAEGKGLTAAEIELVHRQP